MPSDIATIARPVNDSSESVPPVGVRTQNWVLSQPPTTVEVCTSLQGDFDHFNRELFDGCLPPCLIRLQRTGKSTLGYYHGAKAHYAISLAVRSFASLCCPSFASGQNVASPDFTRNDRNVRQNDGVCSARRAAEGPGLLRY
jgi:hypothetical protein